MGDRRVNETKNRSEGFEDRFRKDCVQAQLQSTRNPQGAETVEGYRCDDKNIGPHLICRPIASSAEEATRCRLESSIVLVADSVFIAREMLMAMQRKNEIKTSKSDSAKTVPKRSYRAPAIRKDQRLSRITGLVRVSGQEN